MKCIYWCNISDARFPPFTRPVTSSALIDFEQHCCARGDHVSAALWVSYMFLWSHCFEASFRQMGLLCQVSSQCVRQRLSSYTTWHLTVDDTSPNPPSALKQPIGLLVSRVLMFEYQHNFNHHVTHLSVWINSAVSESFAKHFSKQQLQSALEKTGDRQDVKKTSTNCSNH